MMVDRSKIAEFLQEWARTIVRGAAYTAGVACVLVVYWLTMLLPSYAAAYIQSGLLPWQAGVMPLDESYGWSVLAAEVVWTGLLFSAALAASRTFGAESNGGDSS